MRRKIIRKTLLWTLLLSYLCLCFLQKEAFADPSKPEIAAQGAILVDAKTGEVLFEKNADTRFYPASITKIMTALLVIENTDFKDKVHFSKTATTNLESGAVKLGLSEGDSVSVKDCLYALMLRSANDAANGLAEHTGGSIQGFAAMMNQRAKALGCTNTNFVNPSGLNSDSHYTTARDMALIARACFENEVFKGIVSTRTYSFPAIKNNPKPVLLTMGHKMIFEADYRYYKGIIGGKTGYTMKAGNTLVTAAQREDVKLIAVILKSSGTHYSDTKKLLDYGFALYHQGEEGSGKPEEKESRGAKENAGAQENTGAKEAPRKEEAVKEAPAGKIGPVGKSLPKEEAAQPGQTKEAAPADAQEALRESGSPSLSGPGKPVKRGWVLDVRGWYYIKENGKRAESEILKIESKDYWFDADAYMGTGWRQDAFGNWFYFREDGSMQTSSWIQYKKLWYYLSDSGKMLVDATTPDGYKVDAQGVWIE
ncbi:MAG: serine hydrolase [Johnsonella sp.]|nr:serine hydrolase [Johnsonella sp.]